MARFIRWRAEEDGAEIDIHSFSEFKETFLGGVRFIDDDYRVSPSFWEFSPEEFRKLCGLISKAAQWHEENFSFPNTQAEETLAAAVECMFDADMILWFPGERDVEIYTGREYWRHIIGIYNLKAYVRNLRAVCEYNLIEVKRGLTR